MRRLLIWRIRSVLAVGAALLVLALAMWKLPITGEVDASNGEAPGGLAGCGDLSPVPPPDGGRTAAPISGGCTLDGDGAMKLRFLSVVDDVRLADCTLIFTLLVDGSGRVAVNSLTASGPTPCNDIVGCHRPDGRFMPTEGEIVTDDDGVRLDLDLCFDTCIGRFAGPTTLRVEQRDVHELHLVPPDGRLTLGTSGLRLEGPALRLYSERAVDL